jgi:hypothetical protein
VARAACCLILLAFVCAGAAGAETFKTYQGAWFAVRYPASFTIKPQQKSASAEGYDAVSFISPDGLVEFYVYSPQWSGEPQWIHRRQGETQTSYSRETARSRTIINVTRQGPGYTRSYADYRDAMCGTRWVFGYQYRNQAAYNKYRAQYLRFKQSLQQYAD